MNPRRWAEAHHGPLIRFLRDTGGSCWRCRSHVRQNGDESRASSLLSCHGMLSAIHTFLIRLRTPNAHMEEVRREARWGPSPPPPYNTPPPSRPPLPRIIRVPRRRPLGDPFWAHFGVPSGIHFGPGPGPPPAPLGGPFRDPFWASPGAGRGRGRGPIWGPLWGPFRVLPGDRLM